MLFSLPDKPIRAQEAAWTGGFKRAAPGALQCARARACVSLSWCLCHFCSESIWRSAALGAVQVIWMLQNLEPAFCFGTRSVFIDWLIGPVMHQCDCRLVPHQQELVRLTTYSDAFSRTWLTYCLIHKTIHTHPEDDYLTASDSGLGSTEWKAAHCFIDNFKGSEHLLGSRSTVDCV